MKDPNICDYCGLRYPEWQLLKLKSNSDDIVCPSCALKELSKNPFLSIPIKK